MNGGRIEWSKGEHPALLPHRSMCVIMQGPYKNGGLTACTRTLISLG
jgi:hypothetical protein